MTKILIVDNTLEEREDVYNTLLLEGYQVFQAENGSVGFKKALKENPDLIISEVVLPELTGLEMLKKLNKETTTNIPLIFLSKKNKKEDVRNGMNAGAENYLEKPFDKKELITVVKRIINKQQLTKNRIQKVAEKDNYFQKEAGRISKIGYWTYDKQSNTRTWSKAVLDIFGINQEEIPSYDIMLNCFNKDSRTKHNKAVINLAKNGESYDMEFEIKNLKNEKRWIQDIGEPIYNSKNQIIGHRGIIRDITVLKKNQDALNQSNERFEMVALANNHAVWDWNILDGKIYRNKTGFNQVFGMDSKRLVEETYHAGAYIHPDDQKRIGKELKILIASLDVNNFSLEYRTPGIDGKFMHISDNGYIVRNNKGRAIRMIGAAKNITKRKKAEQLMTDEKEIMEKIAANVPLKSILKAIAFAIEKQIDNSICSILLMDLDGIHLRHGAAPNLPKDYNLAIDGVAIGENTGSCGTAAYKKKAVFVSDIATDPLWENYKKLALSHGLKACWSLPIISKKEDIVLGTFAIYYTAITIPNPLDIELLKRVSNYMRIAIEKNTSTNKLIKSETKYRKLFERNLAGTYQTTIDGKILRANTTFANIVGYKTSEKLLKQNANTFYFSKEEREVFLKDIKKKKKLINREKILKHKNGSIVYLLENCYLHKDPLLGEDIIEGVMIDITERKKVEKSLQKSFSNIEAILESTADGILVVDEVGNIERYNKKFLELWSIPEEVMLSLDENTGLDYIVHQLANPQKMLAKVKELYENPEAISSDIIELKDGRVFERYSQPNVMNGVNRGRVWSFRNITERINAEKEKQQLFALIETSQDIIAFGDVNGNPTYMNKAARKHLGIDDEKMPSNLKVHDFFDSKEIKFITEDISEYLKKEGRWEGETHIVNIKTKEKIPVHMSAFVIRDNITGKAIGLGNVSRDITERQNIEKSLEESFSNIEAILAATADGILVVDLLGNVISYNEKFRELWDLPATVLNNNQKGLGRLDLIVNKLVHPEVFIAKLTELYANPETTNTDIIELKDGRVIERYSNPKFINGVHSGLVMSFRNITERINTEKEKQQLFTLIETSEDFIAFGDMNGNPTFMNKAAREHLGIDDNKMLSNLKIDDFFDSKEIKFIKDGILEEKGSMKKEGRWEGETHIVNIKNKKKTRVHMSAFVIRDNITGEAIGLGNVSRDLTEIEKINKKLVKANEKAEELAGFKDQFLANMSHEIRTPLGIIIGFTKILLRNAADENQKDQLTAIKTSGDTLLVVINDILDLSKIEAGKMTLEKTELKVPDLINTVLNNFKLQLEEKEQTLKTDYDKCLPKWLLGDPVRINQILFNLIGNAIKFTPSGGFIGVKLNLLKQDKERVFIEIIVSDSGIGIPKDKIDKIFNQYSQSNEYTTREYGGSGLGLNIVKQLIDLMQGTILVKSSLGNGSTFTITIPLLKTYTIENKTKKIVSNDEKLEPLKNIKILIVDDMLINQFLAKTIIEHLGFKSDIADNGEIAIALLEKNDYDIILMDLQMPKMNGWETCIHIRNKMRGQKSRTPIIALSADVSKRDIDRCKEVGMDDYVSKPINETELLEKITRLVTRKNDKIIEYQQEATKICNLKYLKDHLNNKPVYITEMLQMILKEIPVIIEQANKSIAAGDWKGLHRKMHSIKPTLILMGLPKAIIAISKQIEENAEKEEHLDVVYAQFIKLEKALEKAYTELEVELNTIKS
ncbi:hypothetical protein BST83_05950 [Polaribacter filamentus]|uniref:histidine kinase n=1 Tax=Polaribacter filamentus TaxID=53483 RepID=A0A2S7KW34_9FLAO|nr:PAS domain S-box protein [Polaribacter filamentus]PQB06748.1 hypothetical protein BST83_05950 [Polaribacter filamentus]